jgi:hypothetical protein
VHAAMAAKRKQSTQKKYGIYIKAYTVRRCTERCLDQCLLAILAPDS